MEFTRVIFVKIDDYSKLKLNNLVKYVHPTRMAHCLRYLKRIDKMNSMIAAVLLKFNSSFFDFSPNIPDIVSDIMGQPILINSKWYCSISHYLNFIAVAISSKPVGVDVEGIMNITDDIVSEFMDDVEVQNDYYGSEKYKSLLRAKWWVQKESYLKYLGVGFHIMPKDIKLNEIKNDIFYINENICEQNNIMSICSEYFPKVLEYKFEDILYYLEKEVRE